MSNTPDPNKSCLHCPSFMSPGQAADYYGRPVGASMCARYGRVIATINSTNAHKAKVASVYAANCPSFGLDAPSSIPWPEQDLVIALPDTKALRAARTPFNPMAVTTCSSCKFFVREDIVAREFGVASGLCSVKGKMILGNRQRFEARDCDYRDVGTVRTDLDGVELLPQLDPSFVTTNIFSAVIARESKEFVDPKEYPTDREVAAEDKESGIRAWRKVVDRETGREVYLPIFERSLFDAEEAAKIPQVGDAEHPEDYLDHGNLVYKVGVLWQELDETPAMWGQAGTGKTELGRHLAWLMQLPFERISVTGSTEIDDLQGFTEFKNGETVFNPGRIPRAWQKPCVFVLDEPNLGQPDVFQFCRSMFDNSKQLIVDAGGDRLPLKRHDACYGMVAMNPSWDIRNIGTNQIADADANRLMHIYVDMPDERLEREIIKKRVEHDGWEIEDAQLRSLMAIARDIRDLCDNGTLDITWAIRPQLKVARLLRWFDWITAYKMASADYLDPTKQEILLNTVRSHVV